MADTVEMPGLQFKCAVRDCDYCHRELEPCVTLGMEESTFMCRQCLFDGQWAIAQFKVRIERAAEAAKEG